MRTLPALLVAVVAVVAPFVGACGGADPVALKDYETAFRGALCEYLVRCGQLGDVGTCRAANLGFDARLTASQQAALAAGKTTYDGDKARACFDAFAERSCDVTSQSNRLADDACREIIRGTLHAGAVCGQDAECISQACEVPSCEGACCQGTCAGDTAPGRAKIGESCETATCETQAYCDEGIATCAARKTSGMSCLSSEECGFGLDCDHTSGTCLPLPGPGAACSGACRDDGLTCNGATRTCVKVALAGEACSTSADCSTYLRCDTSKRCTAGIALGATCVSGQLCADDHAFCEVAEGAQTGTCVLPKADGEPCARDSHCESRSCEPFTLRCRPEPVCI